MTFSAEYTEDAPTLEQVEARSGHTLLEFGTPWCGHCSAAGPAIQMALAEYPNVEHIRVYDGKGKRLGRAFRVTLWPTLIALHDGKEVTRIVRPTHSREVQQLLTN